MESVIRGYTEEESLGPRRGPQEFPPLGNKTPCFSRATLQAMKERQLRRSPQKAGSFVTRYTRGNEGEL